jgi:predicted RNA-binding protein with PIN domain
MIHFIIDGNNLIGKIPSIKNLQRKNRQASREKLANLLGRYFSKGRNMVTLHFDGHVNETINVAGIKIKYSGSKTADDKIKNEIERSRNPKNITVVTSDNNVAQFARVCSCQVIKSEDFSKKLFAHRHSDDEQSRIEEINNLEEFKKLFGAK